MSIVKRERKGGKTAYLVRPHARGKRLPAKTFDTLTEARAYEGGQVSKRGATASGRIKAKAFADTWTEDYRVAKRGPTRGREKGESTLYNYRCALKTFKKEFGKEHLDDIDRPTARRFAATWPPSVTTVVRNMMQDAYDDGLIEANPFSDIQLPHSDGRAGNEVISAKDLNGLADASIPALGSEYGPLFRAAILFSAYVGPREESMWHLERDDLDAKEREAHFRVVKNDRPYKAVLLPEAIEALKSFVPRATPFVFTALGGGQFTKGSHFYAWDKVRQHAGMPDYQWHELRHWCGHHFYITLGFSPEEAGAQLGHKDGRMIIQTYGHGSQGALERLKRGTEKPVVAGFGKREEATG